MKPEIIETPRLILRKARPEDAVDLHDAMSRPEAMRYWTRPAHERLDETEGFVARMIVGEVGGKADDFVIVSRDQGRVIGKAGGWNLPEVGFLLHPGFWGMGLAHEAMAAVVDHLFRWHGPEHLTAEADPRNAGSLRLLARLGFRETHRAERTLLWGEEWCDSVYLALPRGDWGGTPGA